MPRPERYEALILGSGNGGMYLAFHMARSGRRTAIVERRWIGGSCPNINCLPSKNEIWSAKVTDLVQHAARFGSITGAVAIDMAKDHQRKRDMVDGLITTTLQQYEESGAELILGEGHFVAPKTLEVRYLIVLGGGYVGLEFAQAYRRSGSRVTIIEYGSQLAGREDPDVADEVRGILSDNGVDVLVAAETLRVQDRSGRDVSLRVRTSSGEQTIEGSDILLATRRVPNTAGIGLDLAGVELDGHGYIKANDRLETRRPRSGRSENVPAAHSLRTYPSTTSASYGTIWPERTARRATDWFPTVYLRIHRLPG